MRVDKGKILRCVSGGFFCPQQPTLGHRGKGVQAGWEKLLAAGRKRRRRRRNSARMERAEKGALGCALGGVSPSLRARRTHPCRDARAVVLQVSTPQVLKLG